MVRFFIFLSFFSVAAIHAQPKAVLGIEQTEVYLPKVADKNVALLVNQTSMWGNTHLVDLLQSKKLKIRKIFSPEHGFRGDVSDGEKINDSVDTATGIAIVSLYGSGRKPTPEQLADVDVVIFDIQDVGTRFYTYISTLHYLMEACAENNKKVIVLDRPNPNSFIDGPILQPELKSFVGMHPIPITHGMTIGEYAQMINGEGWLDGGKKCELEVIKMKNWKHGDKYSIPVRPSPNLPNNHAIAMYPSICLFEGTALSLGRGTQNPFEMLGHPDLKNQPFQFTPVSIATMSKTPPLENKLCYGVDLRSATPQPRIDLHYLIDMYNIFPDKEKFFIAYFDKLAGTKLLKEQIKQGMSEEQIRATWKPDLDVYKEKRKKYVLYP